MLFDDSGINHCYHDGSGAQFEGSCFNPNETAFRCGYEFDQVFSRLRGAVHRGASLGQGMHLHSFATYYYIYLYIFCSQAIYAYY